MSLVRILFLFFLVTPLYSLDPLEYHQSFPVRILGETPEMAWDLVGAPLSLSLVEGALGQQVISSEHERGVTLYWFDDRVWQVRFHDPWSEVFWNITLGMKRPELVLQLGAPFMQTEDMMIYSLPDIGFPVEGRFFFDDQGLEEIYYYRSDF